MVRFLSCLSPQAFIDLYVPTRKEVVEAEAPRNASMFRRIVTLGYAK